MVSSNPPPLFGLAAVCAAIHLCFVMGPARAADAAMAPIVENVRVNEELYRNVEVIYLKTYRLNKDCPDVPKFSVNQNDNSFRCVSQNGMLYVQESGAVSAVDGRSTKTSNRLGYDGELTRVLKDGVANVHDGRKEPCSVFRPHVWALSKPQMCFPLSLLLRGGADLRKFPRVGVYSEIDARPFLDGEEVVDGLRCFKIRLEEWRDGKQPFQTGLSYVWLATDRNYLPVKKVAYAFSYSKTIPIAEAIAADIREVSPGVWLPYRLTGIVYDELEIHAGRKTVNNTTEFKVETAQLDPKYDVSLFRDIPIPDGTPVYEVKNDKVTSSYIKGGVAALKKPSRFGWWAWALIAGLVSALVTAGVYFRRNSSGRG